jgi:hypothetical protein
MSTKGMSVVAARILVDRLCGANGIPLLVLHDFDKSGFSILGTLRRNNRRYRFRNRVQLIDLGLRLADVEEQRLEAEDVFLNYSEKIRANLRSNGATPEEINFLCGGVRVELNALGSRELVDWIEGKLKHHGVKKVVPDDEVLECAYKRAFVRQSVHLALPEVKESAKQQLRESGVPKDLRRLVEAEVASDPGMPWDAAVAIVAARNCQS